MSEGHLRECSTCECSDVDYCRNRRQAKRRDGKDRRAWGSGLLYRGNRKGRVSPDHDRRVSDRRQNDNQGEDNG